MDEERTDEQRAEEAGDKSERLLEESFLSGGVGMGAGPRLSASVLNTADDGESEVVEDGSWKSHAVEEGELGDAPVPEGGLRGRLRRLFGR